MVKCTRTGEFNKLLQREYPYLGINLSGQVVLFHAQRKGMNVNGEGWPIGFYSSDWLESEFQVFEGQVTLENQK